MPLELHVQGDYACFTSAEHIVERRSYPVMTPSAARGILSNIFWKPEMRWIVQEIHVYNPIQYESIMQNEVKDGVINLDGTIRYPEPIYADDMDQRTQRQTIALRNVAYKIVASIETMPHATAPQAKYRDIFRRRVRNGAFYSYHPFFGQKEMIAYFSEPKENITPLPLNMDLGSFLFDFKYRKEENPNQTCDIPLFFQAKLENGILRIPRHLYKEAGLSACS